MNNLKRVLSAALAIVIMSAAVPVNTFASGVSVSLSSAQVKSLPEDVQGIIAEATDYGQKLKEFKAENDKETAASSKELLKLSQARINMSYDKASVLKQAETAKKEMQELVMSSSQLKSHKIKEYVIEGKTLIAKIDVLIKQYEKNPKVLAVLNGVKSKVESGVYELSNSSAQVGALIKNLSAQIDKMAQDRINYLNGNSSSQNDKNKDKDKVLDEIKDADSIEELDDIYIPDNLKSDFDIVKAKADRREELRDDMETQYSDYDKEDKLHVRRIRINRDEDNRSKWIVEGNVDDHIREYVSIFYNERFVGGGYTDGDGYFEITVSEEVKDNSSLEFFAGKSKYFEKDEIRIEPWDIKFSTYYVEGKYEKDTLVRFYYRNKYIGEARTNADGKFRIRSERRLTDLSDMKFYKKDNTANNASGINIISAGASDTKILGTSNSYAEILVKDDDGVRLGKTRADYNGNFTVLLNRALKLNETLKITVSEKDRDDINIEYIVRDGMESGNLSRMAYAKGYPNGNFKAGANISRAETVMMFARLINGSENFNTPNTTKFEDAEDDWYAQAINFVVDKGLMNGYPNGDFEPDSYITRAEFTTMVSRYVKGNNNGASGLKDINNHWAKEAIEALYGNKMISGYPDGTFKPEENITRAEAVTVLNAAFGRKSTLNSMDNISNPEMLITFNDVKKSDWYYAEVLDATNDHESFKKGNTEIWTVVK
ncbi:S-layer homology domain-containing protein [Peptoniphilus stercorisuis]|uniref:Holliday junction resolvase-like endonuclease n=1 Tax=Peptoniphilus stercorisuis TaxID=1436965 RepID=A0ABS4KCY1_9FIRM|nr:S-layer homology domain-containing protein [Peptoniphilus stercorisuis]MBP2025634.1 putative Holliday junction resolvase-like endonuclease [Peptoniphilus stercorisuis]